MNKKEKGHVESTYPSVVREYSIDGKDYIVRSVFVGTEDIKTVLLRLAEKNALREMGLDSTRL